jgi:hypothetical protein
MDTDYMGSCKSNYHAITTKEAANVPYIYLPTMVYVFVHSTGLQYFFQIAHK